MRCVPNYVEQKADVPECSWVDHASFLGKLIENLFSENTKCIPSCKETKYRLRVESSEPIENFYDPLTVMEGKTRSGLENFLFGNKTGAELLNLVQFDKSVYEVIKSRVKKLTLVDIGFGTSDYKLITRDVRATFFDKLSLIGGTLGLYTGFSLISILEIIFWFGKWLHQKKNQV